MVFGQKPVVFFFFYLFIFLFYILKHQELNEIEKCADMKINSLMKKR
jgi:hypothetical protein